MLGLIFAFFISIAFVSIAFLLLKESSKIGMIDVFWCYLMFILLLISFFTGQGLILLLLTSVWLLRLAIYIYYSKIKNKPVEPRYARYREQAKEGKTHGLYVLFLFQGIASFLLSLPFFSICHFKQEYISGIEWIAILLWCLSFLGEGIADLQLFLFKKNKINKGKVYSGGLWKYSRHPNYFFESCIWYSYALLSIKGPWGWVGIIAAIIMNYSLLYLTGIPKTEEVALETYGESYKQYQQQTSKFIPRNFFKR